MLNTINAGNVFVVFYIVKKTDVASMQTFLRLRRTCHIWNLLEQKHNMNQFLPTPDKMTRKAEVSNYAPAKRVMLSGT
jgi:hypothetical protein